MYINTAQCGAGQTRSELSRAEPIGGEWNRREHNTVQGRTMQLCRHKHAARHSKTQDTARRCETLQSTARHCTISHHTQLDHDTAPNSGGRIPMGGAYAADWSVD